ncbi:MAG: Csu type fimbrial protein [Janthinobacterium lividum]
MQKYFQSITSISYLLVSLLLFFIQKANADCYALGCTCSIAVTGMNFGIIRNFPATTTASINVSCAALLPGQITYDITLGTGNSGIYTMRKMSNGLDNLNYNIYTSLNYQSIWGGGTSDAQKVSENYTIKLLTLHVKNYTAYGMIPINQNVPGGAYSDNIVVNVNF